MPADTAGRRVATSRLLVILCAGAFPALVPERVVAQDAADCDCASQLEALAAKIDANYLAARLPSAKRRGAEYAAWRAEHRRMALEASPQTCLRVLQGFVTFFRDHRAGRLPRGRFPAWLSDYGVEP